MTKYIIYTRQINQDVYEVEANDKIIAKTIAYERWQKDNPMNEVIGEVSEKRDDKMIWYCDKCKKEYKPREVED